MARTKQTAVNQPAVVESIEGTTNSKKAVSGNMTATKAARNKLSAGKSAAGKSTAGKSTAGKPADKGRDNGPEKAPHQHSAHDPDEDPYGVGDQGSDSDSSRRYSTDADTGTSTGPKANKDVLLVGFNNPKDGVSGARRAKRLRPEAGTPYASILDMTPFLVHNGVNEATPSMAVVKAFWDRQRIAAADPAAREEKSLLSSAEVKRRAEKRVSGMIIRSAVPRKISADLDPIDKMLLDMVDAKYPHEHIRDSIKTTYGVEYNMKSIVSRYIRLSLKVGEANAEALESGSIEWTPELDEACVNAYYHGKEWIQQQIQYIHQRHFVENSRYLSRTFNAFHLSGAAIEARAKHCLNLGNPPTAVQDPSGEAGPSTTTNQHAEDQRTPVLLGRAASVPVTASHAKNRPIRPMSATPTARKVTPAKRSISEAGLEPSPSPPNTL